MKTHHPLFLFIGALFVFSLTGCLDAKDPVIEEREDFSSYFEKERAVGTFVLYDLQKNHYLVYDLERARQPFIPASTFKIVNSLIALETGAIADTSTIIAWDGQERNIASWNRDHSITTAFPNSVVWFYQELARRIGVERMQDYIDRMGYGNGDIGGGIDLFWLNGNLRISAMEQVELLVRLSQDDLPFSAYTIQAVKDIMVEERGADYLLRAKTGWDGDIGWYVGYIERAAQYYFFALNLNMDRMEQAASRKIIARSIMRDLGLL